MWDGGGVTKNAKCPGVPSLDDGAASCSIQMSSRSAMGKTGSISPLFRPAIDSPGKSPKNQSNILLLSSAEGFLLSSKDSRPQVVCLSLCSISSLKEKDEPSFLLPVVTLVLSLSQALC